MLVEQALSRDEREREWTLCFLSLRPFLDLGERGSHDKEGLGKGGSRSPFRWESMSLMTGVSGNDVERPGILGERVTGMAGEEWVTGVELESDGEG